MTEVKKMTQASAFNEDHKTASSILIASLSRVPTAELPAEQLQIHQYDI